MDALHADTALLDSVQLSWCMSEQMFLLLFQTAPGEIVLTGVKIIMALMI